MKEGEAVIGIDLGTTYSCVAVARDGTIEIIANDQGNRTTPSFVAFDQNVDRLIGEAAKNQSTLNPTRTFFDVKRLIGKKFDDPEVQNDINYLPYPVVNKNGKPHVKVNDDEVFSVEEISAMVLGKMKETAEAYLGKPVARAVVTVPAYFNDAQRQATKDAGEIAGLEVYDLGGGTFDVSILEIEADGFKVLATGGDTHLGGGDFDQRVMKYFIEVIKRKYKKDVSGDNRALGKLRKECERAKRALSGQLMQVSLNIDCFLDGMDFSEVLTRARFEELNMDLFKKTMDVVKSTMKDARMEKGDIDEIVLVGGSTRIPRVREMLRDMFDGKEPSKGVNPDEAVAYGAAVLGANLSGALDAVFYNVTLCDVTPLSLGVHIKGDLMSVIIPRNTPIPTKMSSVYHTMEDQQTSVCIKVYQGERPLTKDCIKLGEFNLYGLTPAPRGVTRMEETFEIDENGILTVTAREKGASGTSKSLTITSYKGDLTKTQIQRMIRKAKKMAKKDKIAKARVDARNRLERCIYDLNNVASSGELEEASRWLGDEKMETELEDASRWLDENQDAIKEDYAKKMKQLKVKARR
ncbi:Heat shock 70 kDa protein BIP2 [Linum perenne]